MQDKDSLQKSLTAAAAAAAVAAAAAAPDTVHQLTCISAPGHVPYGLFSFRSSGLRFQRLFYTLCAAVSVSVCVRARESARSLGVQEVANCCGFLP